MAEFSGELVVAGTWAGIIVQLFVYEVDEGFSYCTSDCSSCGLALQGHCLRNVL